MTSETTPAAQDYLKCIFMLGQENLSGKPISTKAVAGRMDVSAASATNMLKRLAQAGLLEHSPYRGAQLTDGGRKVALEVIRHHRLLETYLAEALGVPWDRVHQEAEVLEHVLSEDLEERIAQRLGHPTCDPHGHPIPTRDLAMPGESGVPLWAVPDGDVALIDSVSDDVPEALRFLAEAGIRPGARVRVLRRGPVAGPLFVQVEGADDLEHALSQDLAEAVWVA